MIYVNGYRADAEQAAHELRMFRGNVRRGRGFRLVETLPQDLESGRRYELWHASWDKGPIASVEVDR